MAKTNVHYLCSECGWTGAKWFGKCPECGQWGTIDEFHEARPAASTRTSAARRASGAAGAATGIGADGRVSRTRSVAVAAGAARPITEIGTDDVTRIPTGFLEFDRVLGGGIVPGSVVLVAGEPGIGKSTLLLETAGNIARKHAADGGRVLYVSGEESQGQVRLRATRIDAVEENLLLAATTDLATVLAASSRDRKSTRLNSSHRSLSRMPSSA